jgi:hypothetical protein
MELYTVYRILVRIRRLKWLWWSLALLAVLGYSCYQAYLFIDREFMVAKELPYYHVGPRHDDDTLRVAVIGDSWAEWHMTLSCDTLFEIYGACQIVSLVSYASMACYMFHRFFYWAAEKIWNPSDTSVKWLFMAGLVFPVIIAFSYMIQKMYDKSVSANK